MSAADNPTTMQELIDILHREACSLVVRSADGQLTTYNKPGVRDLIWLLDNEPQRLRGAHIADKVIGKAAAALLLRGGVVEAYADVLSRKALLLLDGSGLAYTCGQQVAAIVIPEGDSRCPLEQIVGDAQTADEAEARLRQHFRQMTNDDY